MILNQPSTKSFFMDMINNWCDSSHSHLSPWDLIYWFSMLGWMEIYRVAERIILLNLILRIAILSIYHAYVIKLATSTRKPSYILYCIYIFYYSVFLWRAADCERDTRWKLSSKTGTGLIIVQEVLASAYDDISSKFLFFLDSILCSSLSIL